MLFQLQHNGISKQNLFSSFDKGFIFIAAVTVCFSTGCHQCNRSVMNNSSLQSKGDEKEALMSFTELMVWSSAFAFVTVIILIGNVLTLIVFSTNKKLLRMRANFFLINLAVADMMVGVLAIPMYLYHFVAAWHKGNSVWMQRSYQISKVVDIFVGCASIFTLTVIALERAFSVCLPHIHRHLKNKVYYLHLGLIWLLSVLISLLRLFFEENMLSLEFFFYFMLVFFALALSITCSSYIVIWYRMKLRFARRDSCKRRSTEQDKRLALMLFTVTMVFVLSWMPFQIINIVIFFCRPCETIPHEVAYFTKFLHYGNSCVNPIIYSFLVPEFRRTVACLLRKLRI